MIRHGIILKTGSHGRAQPYGIRPDLYANPPEFYDTIVRPLIESGVDATPGVLAKHGVSFDAMKREAA